MKRQTSHTSAFTLMEIMIVVAIIGLLAAIAVPTYIRARDTSQLSACVNNLRQISAAKNEWAIEKLKDYADIPVDTDLFGFSLYVKDKPICPGGGTYSLNSIAVNPTCTIAGHSLN